MLDAFFEGYFLRSLQSVERRRWDVLQLVAWKEPAEVQGIVGKTIVRYPSAHLANHRHVVINGGDDEVGQLDPHTGFLHGKYGVEHGLQVTAIDATIALFGE